MYESKNDNTGCSKYCNQYYFQTLRSQESGSPTNKMLKKLLHFSFTGNHKDRQ